MSNLYSGGKKEGGGGRVPDSELEQGLHSMSARLDWMFNIELIIFVHCTLYIIELKSWSKVSIDRNAFPYSQNYLNSEKGIHFIWGKQWAIIAMVDFVLPCTKEDILVCL